MADTPSRKDRSTSTGKVMQVAEDFSNGDEFYKRGQLYEASHPAVRKFKQYFKEADVIRARGVEATTATPGELRGEA